MRTGPHIFPSAQGNSKKNSGQPARPKSPPNRPEKETSDRQLSSQIISFNVAPAIQAVDSSTLLTITQIITR